MRFPHKERERHTHHKVAAHSPLSNVMKNNNNAGIPVGFRFHPTDEELVGFYLYGRITSPPPESLEEDLRIIRELDLYRHEPWDLSEVCKIPGDHSENQNNWYFFSHKDKKYPTGNRANRATKAGFWKATGRDKCIQTLGAVGMRKTLVFYRGRAPHGQKTDWIMHEFRLEVDGNLQMLSTSASAGVSSSYYHEGAGAWVVCRVFRKTKNLKSKGDYNDTPSTSVEEDPQMALLPEITDSTEKFSSDEGEHVDYTPAQHLQQYCKQELLLSLNDYSMLQYQGTMLPPEGNREQTNGTSSLFRTSGNREQTSDTSSLFRTSSRSTTITTPNNNTFLDPHTNGTSSLFRTSSRSTTITTPNNHTYLDPTSTALFEHHTMAKMGSCCAHPSSSTAPGFFPPLANSCNHYQAVLEETLPREHIRGLVYRSTPAMLDGLEEIRFGNSVLLQDQSLTSVVTRPQERLLHLQEHLSSAPNHPTVPFGMTNNYMGASLQ